MKRANLLLFSTFSTILGSCVFCMVVETNVEKNPELTDYDSNASPEENAQEMSTNSTLAENFESSEIINRTSRIVGGTEGTAADFPYFAYITSTKADGTTVNCGGAILSDIWVLTAATCVSGTTGTLVYAGLSAPPSTSYLKSHTPSGKAVINTYVPSTFRYNFKLDNIALLKLVSALTLSGTISTIKISKSTVSLDNVSVRTMGMGATEESTDSGTALNYVDIKQIPRSYCDSLTLANYYQYPVNTACLDTSSGKKNICYVDVGGPVVYTYSGSSSGVLVGINSEIVSCTSVYPSAYTKVQPYIAWITKVTKISFV